jgi:hypothetical protein
VIVACANTLADSVGVGGLVRAKLPGANESSIQLPGILTVYSNGGFLVAGPHRDGDMLGVMQALRRRGIEYVLWNNPSQERPDFSDSGLEALALMANLEAHSGPPPPQAPASIWAVFAFLRDGVVKPGESPPCLVLADGTGVWVTIGDPYIPGALHYCPSHHPQFY